MLTKSEDARANSGTCGGCFRCGQGRIMPFSRRGSNPAVDDSRPSILQMNTEGIIRQDQRYRAPNLQEQGGNHRLSTHCTTADKLVYFNFSLAGSVPSRKNVLDTFCLQAVGLDTGRSVPRAIREYKIINVHKPPPSQLTPAASRHSHSTVCMLVT